jgi:hypothetical protein
MAAQDAETIYSTLPLTLGGIFILIALVAAGGGYARSVSTHAPESDLLSNIVVGESIFAVLFFGGVFFLFSRSMTIASDGLTFKIGVTLHEWA